MSETYGITIDDSAIKRIEALRDAKSGEFSGRALLRVAVEGGGCSGFQYKMGAEETINDDDIVFHDAVVIDEISAGYLKDSVVKFQDDLMSAMFVIDNPNAESSCGCQASFAIDPNKMI